MIQEVKRVPRMWKFPGGLMDPGETIEQAVKREVIEETGVMTEFKGIIGFREQLMYKNGASDLYMVCLLVPADEDKIDIQIIDK